MKFKAVATLTLTLIFTSAYAETEDRWIQIFKQAGKADATPYFLHKKAIKANSKSPIIQVTIKHDEDPNLTKFYGYNFDCKNNKKQLNSIGAINRDTNKMLGFKEVTEDFSDVPTNTVVVPLHEMSCFIVATKLLLSEFEAEGVIYESTANDIVENFGYQGQEALNRTVKSEADASKQP